MQGGRRRQAGAAAWEWECLAAARSISARANSSSPNSPDGALARVRARVADLHLDGLWRGRSGSSGCLLGGGLLAPEEGIDARVSQPRGARPGCKGPQRGRLALSHSARLLSSGWGACKRFRGLQCSARTRQLRQSGRSAQQPIPISAEARPAASCRPPQQRDLQALTGPVSLAASVLEAAAQPGTTRFPAERSCAHYPATAAPAVLARSQTSTLRLTLIHIQRHRPAQASTQCAVLLPPVQGSAAARPVIARSLQVTGAASGHELGQRRRHLAAAQLDGHLLEQRRHLSFLVALQRRRVHEQASRGCHSPHHAFETEELWVLSPTPCLWRGRANPKRSLASIPRSPSGASTALPLRAHPPGSPAAGPAGRQAPAPWTGPDPPSRLSGTCRRVGSSSSSAHQQAQ